MKHSALLFYNLHIEQSYINLVQVFDTDCQALVLSASYWLFLRASTHAGTSYLPHKDQKLCSSFFTTVWSLLLLLFFFTINTFLDQTWSLSDLVFMNEQNVTT